MARWRLINAHYLSIAGTTWEYKEVDRSTGKQIRREFPVPLYLNPGEPSDWNYRIGRDEGEIIVSDGNGAEPRDLIFAGDPTPDMEPLDDAARKISAGFADRWKHPIESLPGSFSQSLLDGMQREIATIQSQTKTPTVEGMSELLGAMTTVMKQNAELLAALSSRRA